MARTRSRALRWIRRGLTAIAAFLILLLATGAGFEQFKRWRAMHDYPPTGRMVEIDGARRMHIDCRGQGKPTVVFESGAGPLGGLDWGRVQDPIAAFTRACSYSRAGELWSDPANAPLTAIRVAQDLHATLSSAGEDPPYILVGHSLGGPYAVIFTAIFPDDVAGLVLVDPSFPDQDKRLAAIVGPAKSGEDAQLRMLRLANTLDWTGLTRLLFARLAADPKLPPGAGDTALAWLFRTLPTLVEEYTQAGAIIADSGQYRDFGTRPVIVLTAGGENAAHATELGLTPSEAARVDEAWLHMHQEEAAWSHRGQIRVITGTAHFIQLEKPQAVIDAVRDVVSLARSQ
jgi:pimeloyl-ACP methyl ester carboxylesterase